MNRSLLIGILATVALITSIAIYFYFNNIKTKKIAAAEAVPVDAFLICKTTNVLTTWSNLKTSSLWKDLVQNASLSKKQMQFDQLTEILKSNATIDDALNENTTVISFHQANNDLAFFAVNEIGDGADLADIASFIASKVKGSFVKRNFEQTLVFDIVDELSKPILTISYKDELLFCSPHSVLVEEAIRRLKYHIPFSSKGFEQIDVLAESSDDATLFINYQKINELFSLATKPEFAYLFKYLGNFANWGMLGVSLTTDQISIKGVTYTDDSLFQFLDLFKNQTPKALSLQQYMPANTAFALQMGFTDYLKFNEELNDYLQAHQKLEGYRLFTDSIENQYQIDISRKILSFIDGEAALTMTEPASADYTAHLAAFIRFKNADAMLQSLTSTVAQMHKKGEVDSVNITYNGVEIERIKLSNFLKLYYGEIMGAINSPYFARINDVFIFTNQLSTLKNIIDANKNGNTLVNNEQFKAYEKQLAPSNNISVFISPVKLLPLSTVFASETFFSALNTHQLDFKKLEYINIQFSNTNNKAFYTQLNYKYNTIKTDQTQLLWNLKLDTTFNMEPQVVYNTSLKQQTIFVQDVKNTLYCLSMSGNLIWRSKLSAPLVGEIITVDIKRNGSNNYLFATEKQLFLIDENGVSLPNYPIGLPGKTSTSFSLINPYNDSNSYILVPLENNRISGYTIFGKSMQGFNPKRLEAKLSSPIASFLKGSQTLLYATDVAGNLVVFNLKGKQVNYSTEVNAMVYLHSSQNDTLITEFNAIDSAGKVTKLTFDSLNSLIKIKPVTTVIPFKRITISNQLKNTSSELFYMLHSPTLAVVYNGTFEKKMELSVIDSLSEKAYFTYNFSGKPMIGLSKPNTNAYNWYNTDGKLYPDFPIKGINKFGIGDIMNNRSNYLIGGDALNNIFVYKLK